MQVKHYQNKNNELFIYFKSSYFNLSTFLTKDLLKNIEVLQDFDFPQKST